VDLQADPTNRWRKLPTIYSIWYHSFWWTIAIILIEKDILRVTGYLVYYRFINLMIVTPMEFKVVDVRDLNVNTTKNLVAVAKVLQQLFYLRNVFSFSTFV
jgi:hypothetical protein